MEQPDPERLLAEALRAQAVRAPLEAASQPDPLLKLLSGTDAQHDLLSGRASDTIGIPPAGPAMNQPTSLPTGPPRTARLPAAAAPMSAWWIVLLAVLLGLAAGAVVGLISIV
ncbi:MAG TPA: hypothetical protein VH352_03230 [Pseudonocardiaceae bacterium]|nr:hypothetical protein [Pseudonocardiaceae bacterium]